MTEISKAVAAMGSGSLNEAALVRHVFPLFSRSLANENIYLANHSLGRPTDQVLIDISFAVAQWEQKLGDAWDDWLEERWAYRSRIAKLIGAARTDCVVPKTSAGQGLRAVLNAMPGTPRVVTTRGEFDSIDLILKQYAAVGRIRLSWAEPDGDGYYATDALLDAVTAETNLFVVSHVMFTTGQLVQGLPEIADKCHANGARLLIDSYHAIGVIPVSVQDLSADFMIGGCYKYLRGGPGACFLYISPEALESELKPIDVGWFAKKEPFFYERPNPPVFADGGNAYLESTPPIMTYFQARSGLEFVLELGVARTREYSLDRLGRLKKYLGERGISSEGAGSAFGAFLTVRHARAAELSKQLGTLGISTDARGEWLRLSPDCLTRDEELVCAADALASIMLDAQNSRDECLR